MNSWCLSALAGFPRPVPERMSSLVTPGSRTTASWFGAAKNGSYRFVAVTDWQERSALKIDSVARRASNPAATRFSARSACP
jgi:hypothetical protein